MTTAHDVIEAHIRWMRAGAYAEKSITSARRTLRAVERDLPGGICESNGEELAAYLANPAWAPNTKLSYFKSIRRFHKWATNPRDQWMTEDPSADLRSPKPSKTLPRPAPQAAVERAIYIARGRWQLACRLAGLQGLRACEMARLHRSHVDEEWTYIWGKGDKDRAVPTHPLVWEIIGPMRSGPIFVRPRGGPATGDWISTQAGGYLKAMGIPHSLYPLRHYFATTIQREHRDIRVTQELLGHASPNTTMRYTEVTASQKREAVTVLPFTHRAGSAVAGSSNHVAAGSGAGAPRIPRQGAAYGRSVLRRALR